MKAKFEIGQEVMHGETLTTVIVSQKDFSAQKVRYQLSTSNGELIYENELSEVSEQTETEAPVIRRNAPAASTNKLTLEALNNEYRAEVGKNPHHTKRANAAFLLTAIIENKDVPAVDAFIEKYALEVDMEKVTSVEEFVSIVIPQLS
jgi:hypothetical protein